MSKKINKNSNYEDYFEYYNRDDKPTKLNIEKLFKEPKDLLDKWYKTPRLGGGRTPEDSRNGKMVLCYTGEKLSGRGLEIGFGMGTSTHWLMDRYDDIVLDGIDFQEHVVVVGDFLKELYGDRIGEMMVGDLQNTEISDNTYDFINSSSVWEHLTEDVYWNILKECHRILKPNGKIYVYADQTAGPAHIRVVPPAVTRKEMEKVGFKAITNYIYTK